MNLFLLAAVPASAVLIHRVWYRDFPLPRLLSTALYSLVWSLLLLVPLIFVHSLATFTGSLALVAVGQVALFAVITPGVPVVLHLAPRTAPKTAQDPRTAGVALGLTLALLFTFLGFTDFLTTDRQSDAWDLFGLPLTRVVQFAGLALVAERLLAAPRSARLPWLALGALLVVLQPLLAVVWYAGWGAVALPLPPLLLALGIWTQKKTASWGDGSPSRDASATSEDPSAQP